MITIVNHHPPPTSAKLTIFVATRVDTNVNWANTTERGGGTVMFSHPDKRTALRKSVSLQWAGPPHSRFLGSADHGPESRSYAGVNIFGEGTNANSWRRFPWEITVRKRPAVSATNIVLIDLFIFIGNLRFKFLKHNCLHLLLFTSEREKRVRNDNYKHTIGQRAAPVRDYMYLSIRFYITQRRRYWFCKPLHTYTVYARVWRSVKRR